MILSKLASILLDANPEQRLTVVQTFLDYLRKQFAIDNAFHAFERACERWRDLYKDAELQLIKAREIIDRHSRGSITEKERKEAESLAKEAQRQRQKDLLVGQSQGNNNSQFDFYPYRYFASEGFLPGFNFPRLFTS